ncbi:hypothetical protein GEMRC1_006501 [Eukaryota sp. GEM-RC1]
MNPKHDIHSDLHRVNSPPSNNSYHTKRIWGFAEPISSWMHFLAAIAFIPLLIRLYFRIVVDWQTVLCIVLYSFSLFFCLLMSGVYHILSPYSMGRLVLRRLDHSAIFCQIAGTVTGLHGVMFTSYARWVPIIILWTIGITGIVLKTVFFKKISDRVGLWLYIGMGWIGVGSFVMMWVTYRDVTASLLLIGGGVSYSLGGIIDGVFEKQFRCIEGFFMSHELFHVFVVLGAYLHYELIVYGTSLVA